MTLTESGRAGVGGETHHVGTETRVKSLLVPELFHRKERADEGGYVANVAQSDGMDPKLAICDADAKIADQGGFVLCPVGIDKEVVARTEIGEVASIGVSMEGAAAVDDGGDGPDLATVSMDERRQRGVSSHAALQGVAAEPREPLAAAVHGAALRRGAMIRGRRSLASMATLRGRRRPEARRSGGA